MAYITLDEIQKEIWSESRKEIDSRDGKQRIHKINHKLQIKKQLILFEKFAIAQPQLLGKTIIWLVLNKSKSAKIGKVN